MLDLKEKYIVNKQQKRVAVQLDIKTFQANRRSFGRLCPGSIHEGIE